MRTLVAFMNLIPGLLHDFNFLGLGILNAATAFFNFLAKVSEADPVLTRLVYGAYLARRAFLYLWVGMGAGAGPLPSGSTSGCAGSQSR